MENFQELHIEHDFWDDFIVEAFEHIDEIESNAMSLEQNPEEMEIINTMFRAFHTIKGLSGFVEHSIIQEVAHKTETMMDYCRKGELKVNTRIVDAILKASDYIKQLCESVDAYRDENLIYQIQALLVDLEEIAEGDKPAEDFVELHVETPDEFKEVSGEPQESKYLEKESQPEEIQQEEIFSEEAPQEEFKVETESEFFSNEGNSESEAESEAEIKLEGLDAFAMEVSEAFDIEETEKTEQDEESEELTTVPEGIVEITPKAEEKIKDIEIKTEEHKELTVEEKELKSFQKNVLQKLKDGSQPAQKVESAPTVAKALSANEEYMKVANYKIDHLVEMMGELIINQALIDQYVALNYNDDRQLVTNMSGFLRITRELQNLSMSLRMVSLKSTFQKLTRIARDTINELHKNVEFVTSGENVEIDRAVAEKLLEPLVHMIKNAISHGIEVNSEDRIKNDKNPRARVELNAYSKRGKIFLEVRDDGRGIDTEVVYQKAIEKGLADPSKTYSDAEIKEFIMLPGFSTAAVVDNISGRGVGMDVVKTQILKTGGKVEIQSTFKIGSTFTLEVPVNHAIMNGTIIEINEQQFVVPTVNVKEFLQPTTNQWIFTKQERTMIRVRDNIIPIVPLSTFFKTVKEPTHVPLVMILELDQELRALPIVNVVNRQEVVVKPVGTEFSHLRYVSGMSILGTGKVSLILDIDYLFKKEVKE